MSRKADDDDEFTPELFAAKQRSPKRPPKKKKTKELIVISDSDSDSADNCVCEGEQDPHPDLKCLDGKRCLNDAVINAYIKFLSDKYNHDNSIGFTNSFFVNKLRRDGFTSAKNWTGIGGERLDVYQKFLIPATVTSHWILLEINFIERAVKIYDSLGKRGSGVATKIIEFMKRQGIHRKFTVKFPAVPKQDNFHDCGVFVCEYAKYIFMNNMMSPDIFRQSDVPEIRARIRQELSEFTK